jgi:demethylmenaquinone methyltransferase/2-methoxy-6-polyprenyl-1,4-benzoquinol methylase
VGGLIACLANAVPNGGRVLEIGTGSGVGLAWIVHRVGSGTDVEVLSVELDNEIAD